METLRGTAVVAGELVSCKYQVVQFVDKTNSYSNWTLSAKTEKYELLLSKGMVVTVLSDVDVGLK